MKDMCCAYCAKPGELHRDHVVPRSRGGPDNATNIVMACQPCNAAKHDKLASEWLGEECPDPILAIEERVNRKLASDFKKRDYKSKPKQAVKLYVVTCNHNLKVCYIGEVVEDRGDYIRLEAIDALMFVGGGLWWLSGCLHDIPRERCRLFNDRDACCEYAYGLLKEIEHMQRRVIVPSNSDTKIPLSPPTPPPSPE